jgi:predicted RNase H-like nuclease (RuvC/YqgF family)
MTTIEIILSLISTLLGSGLLLTLVTIKQARRKATTDVEKGNIELVTSSVNEMLQSVNALMGQNKELVKEIITRSDENTDLKKKLEQLSTKVEKMQRTIRDVLKALEKLEVEESLISKLKEEIK